MGEDFGNVLIDKDKKIIGFFEKKPLAKSTLTNTGVYSIQKKLFRIFKKNINYSLEKDIIPKLIDNHNIFGLTTELSFYDIGTPERYEKFENNC